MAEEAPGTQCELSEGEKSRCSAGTWSIASSLGCVTALAQRWAGRGLLREGQFHHELGW